MIIGIDLGTTNSLVAVWSGEIAQLIPNALGKVLTPSVVGLDDNGQLVVGDIARERLQTHPQMTIALFKRYMGSAQETKRCWSTGRTARKSFLRWSCAVSRKMPSASWANR